MGARPDRARPELRGAAVEAVGTALPKRRVHSAEIARRLGVADGWIESRTGVSERRVAGDGDSVAELAVAAGRGALERAGADPESLDLVIVATFSHEDLMPNAAPLVAGALGARAAGAFDVGSACNGFLAALAIAAAQVESGRAGHVLVIGADIVSRHLDPGDRRTAALFGDGAGALLVGPASAPGLIGPTLLGADAAGAAHIRAARADGVIHMDGHETFKAAVGRLATLTLEALGAAGLGLDDVDLFVYHQANARILRAVGERLGLPDARVVNAIAALGNTSAASIPLALAAAEADGRLVPGARVLLGAFASGFTWGATTMVWS